MRIFLKKKKKKCFHEFKPTPPLIDLVAATLDPNISERIISRLIYAEAAFRKNSAR